MADHRPSDRRTAGQQEGQELPDRPIRGYLFEDVDIEE